MAITRHDVYTACIGIGWIISIILATKKPQPLSPNKQYCSLEQNQSACTTYFNHGQSIQKSTGSDQLFDYNTIDPCHTGYFGETLCRSATINGGTAQLTAMHLQETMSLTHFFVFSCGMLTVLLFQNLKPYIVNSELFKKQPNNRNGYTKIGENTGLDINDVDNDPLSI